VDTRMAELLRRLVLGVPEACARRCDTPGIGNESASIQGRVVG
jgi:hypothetical protein